MENIFPSDYNKQDSPPGEPGNPNPLYISLNVIDIDKIEESSMEFSIQAYLREMWKDRRLNLSCCLPKDGIANFGVPDSVVDRLWTPDIVFDNVKSGVLFSLSVPNRFVLVLETGHFYRATRYNLIIGCHMNFLHYPLDIQECHLKISLLSNPDRKLKLHWIEEHLDYKHLFKGVSFDSVIRPLKYELLPPKAYKTMEIYAGEWCALKHWSLDKALEKTAFHRCNSDQSEFSSSMASLVARYHLLRLLLVDFSEGQHLSQKTSICRAVPENYTYLFANFTFVRKLSGSIFNVYIPSTLVVCLSWTSFWIDVGAVPARITLGVTSFLTLVTQMVQARNSLPAISYMTAMDLWLFVCLLKVFCSILVYAFTYRLYIVSIKDMESNSQKTSHEFTKPKARNDLRTKSLLSDQKVFTLRKPNYGLVQSSTSKKSCLNPQSVDKFCRIIFPLLFLIFASTYWTYFLRYT